MRSPLSFRKQTSLEIGTARHGMAWKSAPQVAEAAQDHADKQKRVKAAQAQAKKPRHKIPAGGPELVAKLNKHSDAGQMAYVIAI